MWPPTPASPTSRTSRAPSRPAFGLTPARYRALRTARGYDASRELACLRATCPSSARSRSCSPTPRAWCASAPSRCASCAGSRSRSSTAALSARLARGVRLRPQSGVHRQRRRGRPLRLAGRRGIGTPSRPRRASGPTARSCPKTSFSVCSPPADGFNLLSLERDVAERARAALDAHPIVGHDSGRPPVRGRRCRRPAARAHRAARRHAMRRHRRAAAWARCCRATTRTTR